MKVFEDVLGVESIVTLLLSFMFILSLKNVLRRPPKNQKQQSLRSLLGEIEEEEKDDEEIKEKIENKAKMKPKLYSSKKSRTMDNKNIKFEDSPLRMYDDGDLFTAARSIKASLDQHSPISKSLIEDMKSLCIMVSKHAKMLESLDSRLSMLEEKPLHSSSSFITNNRRQHEPTRVEMLSSPRRQNKTNTKMNIDEATRISKSAEFNVELSRNRIDNAMREAFELN